MRLYYILPQYFIITTVCSFVLQEKLYSENESNNSKLEELIQKVRDTWVTHDVVIVSQNNRSDNKVNEAVTTITKSVLPFYPTQHFRATNSSKLNLDDSVTATSRTLLIFVYGARMISSLKEIYSVLQYLPMVCHKKHSPKILFLLILDKKVSNMSLSLKQLFRKGYSPVVALEMSSSRNQIPGNEAPSSTDLAVHRYKRVPSTYTRVAYDGNVSDWYIDRYQNLMGMTLKLCYQNESKTGYGKLLKLQLEVMRETMNVSFVTAPLSEGQCDMTYDLFFLFHNQFYYTSRDHTAPIYMDRFCLYMPKLSEVATNVWWGPIMAFLMGIIIVLLVLGFSTLVGIGTFDRPFSVIAVILSVSLKTMKLSSLTEKILYLCLVQVATRYMSLLYTELFSETAVGQKELKINEFDDLYPLNVKILMTESMYNFFSNGNESSVPRDLLPKFHVKQGTDKSNINDNNVGYFSMNLLEIYRQDLTERPQKKKTNLCLGNVAIVQMLPIRWWYKDRVNDLFLRTNEYGLRDHENKMNFRWAEDQVMEQQLEEGPSAQRKMVMVLLYGYLFVVAVFVGEVMVKQLQRKKINNKM